MTDVDELLQTLLYEGYALYPYTPGATKNATPTPFGIVYPPAYAAGAPTTFDHVRMAAIAEGDADAALSVEVHFLEHSGERHEARRAARGPAGDDVRAARGGAGRPSRSRSTRSTGAPG